MLVKTLKNPVIHVFTISSFTCLPTFDKTYTSETITRLDVGRYENIEMQIEHINWISFQRREA